MDDTISVDEYEAEPLPEKKKQLDEMQLIAWVCLHETCSLHTVVLSYCI